MPELNRLIQLMKQLEDQLIVCMRCGLCQAVCPLYAQTGRESDVARGKLALLDGLINKMFDDPEGTYQRLDKCLLCGSCQANCPSGVSALEIFMKARAILTGYLGLSPAKKFVLRGLLAHPKRLDYMVRWGAKFQKLFSRPANDVIGSSCARFMSPLIGDRHFMPLADQPFHTQIPSLNTRGGRSGLRVAFYVGCLLDKIYPRVAHAVLKALDFHEVDVFMPESQACCGIPAISSGDLQTFEKLVGHNIQRFADEKVDFLVTACATCTSTIKEVWPVMLSKASPVYDQARQLAAKTMDINQFLVTQVGAAADGIQQPQPTVSVTYHDPCHLKKAQGVWREPRQLLQASGYCLFREMPQADACCGMGGSFNLRYYGISSKIGQLKIDNISATQCNMVATGCPACMLQLSDILSKSGKGIAVRHVIEIYAESLKRHDTSIKAHQAQENLRSGL